MSVLFLLVLLHQLDSFYVFERLMHVVQGEVQIVGKTGQHNNVIDTLKEESHSHGVDNYR